MTHAVNVDEQLDRTFAALSNPTRRAILARLERDGVVTVGQLAEPFAIKLPAVMKHLDALDSARLITRVKLGRTVSVALKPAPMRQAMRWLVHYERFWAPRLDRLAKHAEAREAQLRKSKK